MIKGLKFLIIFGIIMSFAIFGLLMTKSILDENIVNPAGQQFKTVAVDLGLDPLVSTEIQTRLTYFTDFDIGIDLIFLITWIFMETSIILLAINSPRLPTLNFFSFLTLGMLVVMFIFDFVRQFNEWFIQNFISNIFSYSETYLPIFNFYNTYQPIIIFLNILLLLFVNQLFNKGRKQIIEDTAGPVFNENAQGGLEE